MFPTRREVIAGLSLSAAGAAAPLTGLTAPRLAAAGAAPEEISHAAEAIHQEVSLQADPARVYSALTDAKQFEQVTQLSAAVKSGMVKAPKPAEIGRAPGSPFSLFGGIISGRLLELVPNARIVQAWRAGDWAAGIYSIARFELVKTATGTRLVFDHTGFPKGDGEHLAQGWRENYWEPLAGFLAE